MQTKLDKVIEKLSVKLQNEKYLAINKMTDIVIAECPEYSRQYIRKAVIYYFFD